MSHNRMQMFSWAVEMQTHTRTKKTLGSEVHKHYGELQGKAWKLSYHMPYTATQ